MDKVLAKLAALSGAQKRRICRPLTGYYGPDGWDVRALAFGKAKFESSDEGCATGKCAGSVSYNGTCYQSHSVNYSLFGVLTAFCGYDLQTALHTVTGWRVLSKVGGDDNFEAKGRRAWVRRGHKMFLDGDRGLSPRMPPGGGRTPGTSIERPEPPRPRGIPSIQAKNTFDYLRAQSTQEDEMGGEMKECSAPCGKDYGDDVGDGDFLVVGFGNTTGDGFQLTEDGRWVTRKPFVR